MSLQPERIASATLHIGDCLDVLPQLAAEGFRAHAVVTDPPAGIGFMGREWDSDKGGRDHWIAWMQQVAAETLRCVRPGAHALVWALPRTSHWTATAWENAGWTVRDRCSHIFSTGFPKSLDVSKAIDRAAGAEREVLGFDADKLRPNRLDRGYVNTAGGAGFHADNGATITAPATPEAAAWNGWGTALKPAVEDWWLFRAPLSEGNVAANVLRHGTGAINVDACRVGTTENTGRPGTISKGGILNVQPGGCVRQSETHPAGRWPANLVLSDDPEVEQAFAAFGTSTSTGGQASRPIGFGEFGGGRGGRRVIEKRDPGFGDTGSVSRFFYTCKADARDRAGSKHPCVKPSSLMRWLVRLVCPEGGTILDPFAGSGSTGLAADQCGMRSVLVERDPTYAGDALRKIREDAPLFAEASPEPQPDAAYQRHGDLFADAAD